MLENPYLPAADDLHSIGSLTFAYVGDAVLELLYRTKHVSEGLRTVDKLHKKNVLAVSAKAQAVFAQKIAPHLTEDELSVFSRGKNAKSANIPKNATQHDYRVATAVEALFGYLYLKGKTDRILELFDLGEKP